MQSTSRETLFQIRPARRLSKILTRLPTDELIEGYRTGSLPLPELFCGQSARSIRCLVPVKLVMVSGHLPEAKLALLLPEGPLDLCVVVLRIPGAEGFRMNPVDHQVHVPVRRISVSHDQYLVLL